ncbi:hypothetical protein LCGC14_2060400, partial [marine sediment metagenome]
EDGLIFFVIVKMEKCDICGKKADAFKGYVCYSVVESWLCNLDYKK